MNDETENISANPQSWSAWKREADSLRAQLAKIKGDAEGLANKLTRAAIFLEGHGYLNTAKGYRDEVATFRATHPASSTEEGA